LLASAAQAQPAGTPIVVTARRVAEPADRAPLSVAAIPAAELELMGAETLDDIARAVPNFTIAPTGVLGVSTPAIRGIFSPAGSATVGVYLDDVPVQIRAVGFSRNPDLRVFDLERVEVLRGPQGTLFGANSMGGTIRFITRLPSLDSADAGVSAELGITDGGGVSHELEGAFGEVLVPDKVGLRLAFHHRDDGGHVDRIDRQSGTVAARNVDDDRVTALRGAVRARLSETVEIVPAISYQQGERGDFPFFESDLGAFRQSNLHAQPGEDWFVLPSLTAHADLGDLRLTSVTAYFDREDRQVTDYSRVFGELVLGGAVPGLVPEGGSRSFTRIGQRGLTQEIRLASGSRDAPLHWVAGLFYRDSELALVQEVVEPGIADLAERFFGASVEELFGVPLLPGGISYRGTEVARGRQFAGFGELAWRLGGGVEASAGLRVTRSELDLRVLSQGPYAGGSLTEPADRTQRETPVTPRIGLSWSPAEDRLFYLSVAKGFRIGGANPPVPTAACAEDLRAFGLSEAPLSYDSDTLWNYELGAKASLAQRRLNLAVSAFQIDWSGIQQPVTLPNCGFSYVDNLGTARNRGFEAEVEARPTRGLVVQAAVGFVDARFRSNVLGGRSGASGGRALIVAKGDRIPFVPRWTGRIAAEQSLWPASSRRFYLRVEYQFASAYRRAPSPASVSYDPRVDRGDGYGNLLARLGLEAGRWQVSAFVENLLGDRPILFSSAEFVPVTGVPLRQMTLRPRTMGMAASLRF
jgi:outer membrane receptor protein involved in Fe transport